MDIEIYKGSSDGFEHLIEGYMDYSKDVILRRAVPDLRDGLKPVQRRLLYAAKKIDKKQLQKCVVFVSEGMKIHPHGDSSVWGAMSLMTDSNGSWNMPVFKGMGNFGHVYSSNPPAAYRYPKAMLNANAQDYFKDEKVMNLIPAEEGEGVEPEVLLPIYPVLLVNGTSGIAVSVGTRIPPFNFGDVIDLTIKYLQNNKFDYKADIIYPDFPTGGVLVKKDSEISKIMRTGKGKLKVRAKVSIEKNRIIVEEVPYGKTFEGIVHAVKELTNNPGNTPAQFITDAINVTDKSTDGRAEIICRNKKCVESVLMDLYRRGILQTVFASSILTVMNDEPLMIGVYDVIKKWCEWRKEVVQKKFEVDIKDIDKELTALSYFVRLCSNQTWKDTYVDDVTNKSRQVAQAYLHEIFDDIPDDTCEWIADRAVSAFNHGGKYADRYDELTKRKKQDEKYLKNPESYMIKEMESLKKSKKGQYERKTELSDVDYKFSKNTDNAHNEDMSDCYFTLYKNGYITKSHDSDHKNGVLCQFVAPASGVLIGFDYNGYVLRIRGSEIDYTKTNGRGVYLPKFFDTGLDMNYKILYLGPLDGKTLTLVYRDGSIGRFNTSEFMNKKVTKMVSGGVDPMVHGKLLEVYTEDTVPEYMVWLDKSGKHEKMAYTKIADVRQASRRSRAKSVIGTMNAEYILGLTEEQICSMIKEPDRFNNKVRVVKSEDLNDLTDENGEKIEFHRGRYADICIPEETEKKTRKKKEVSEVSTTEEGGDTEDKQVEVQEG